MKKFKIIIYIAVICAGFVFAGLHTFVSIKGRDLLRSKLYSVFQSEVLIGRVTTSFPLKLIVKDLEVKNWFKIRKVLAGSGMIDIFGGNFILSDLRLEGWNSISRKESAEIRPNPLLTLKPSLKTWLRSRRVSFCRSILSLSA